MSHPTSCTDPACTLRYVEHLRGLQISPNALPSRSVNRTKGKPDEPFTVTKERERRWDREGAAIEQLAAAGVDPPSLAEAPRMLQELGG